MVDEPMLSPYRIEPRVSICLGRSINCAGTTPASLNIGLEIDTEFDAAEEHCQSREPKVAIASSVVLGKDVDIPHKDLVNLYGCRIGDETKIGTFVEIQKSACIGSRCKISTHTFICEGVEIEDEVFVGHGVMFTNDVYPRATTDAGNLKTDADWRVAPTRVGRRASIGSNATILPNLYIGEGALIGAGAVVVRDVPAFAIVAGVPAVVIGDARALAQGGLQEK